MELEEDWEEVLMDDEMEDVNCNKSATQFSCETCQFTTTTRFALNKHQLKHTTEITSAPLHESDDEIILEEEIPHDSDQDSIPEMEEYEIDNDDFATEDVNEEQTIHDVEKQESTYNLPKDKFACQFCDYSCKIVHNLTRHLENRTKHGHSNPFQCDLCPYRNCNQKGIFRHKSIHQKASKYYDYEPVLPVAVVPIEEPKMQESESSTSKLSLRKAIFECSFCSFKAKTRFALTRHIQNHGELEDQRKSPDDDEETVSHHKGNKYERSGTVDWNENTCEYCDFSTSSEKRMENHFKRRLMSKHGPVKCDICGYTSCTKVGLNIHVSRKHQGKPSTKMRSKSGSRTEGFNCDHCDFKAFTEKRLDNHLQRRSECDYDPISCQVCGYKSCTKKGLEMHFQRRHGYLQDSSNDVKKEERAPKVPKPLSISNSKSKVRHKYFCQYCDFGSQTEDRLTNHYSFRMKNHTSGTLFTCDICQYRICTKHGLKMHKIKRHGTPKSEIDVKPVPLVLKFSKKSLSEHKKHACHKCDYKTTNRTDLAFHVKASLKIETPRKCEKCSETRCTYHGLLMHYRKDHGAHGVQISKNSKSKIDQWFHCNQCDFSTKYQANLDRHQRNLHPEEKENKKLEKVYYVLPRPQKGVWIVPLEKIDPDDIEYMDFD